MKTLPTESHNRQGEETTMTKTEEAKIKTYRDLVRYLLYVNSQREICVGTVADIDISDELDTAFAKRVQSLLKGKWDWLLKARRVKEN